MTKSFKQFMREAWVQPTIDKDADTIARAVQKIAEKIAAKYKKHETNETSHPAAPNSSVFRATVSGMIEVRPEHVHRDYLSPAYCPVFIKIGGGVDIAIRKAIREEFRSEVLKKFKLADGATRTTDGFDVNFQEVSGSNWGGIGLAFKKVSTK